VLEIGADQAVAVVPRVHFAFSRAADDRFGHRGIL